MRASVHRNTQISLCQTFTLPPQRVSNVTNLAEGEADASPAPEDVVPGGAFLHAGIMVQKVPAGHAAAGVPWLGTATQALVVAALALAATCAVLTVLRAH